MHCHLRHYYLPVSAKILAWDKIRLLKCDLDWFIIVVNYDVFFFLFFLLISFTVNKLPGIVISQSIHASLLIFSPTCNIIFSSFLYLSTSLNRIYHKTLSSSSCLSSFCINLLEYLSC